MSCPEPGTPLSQTLESLNLHFPPVPNPSPAKPGPWWISLPHPPAGYQGLVLFCFFAPCFSENPIPRTRVQFFPRNSCTFFLLLSSVPSPCHNRKYLLSAYPVSHPLLCPFHEFAHSVLTTSQQESCFTIPPISQVSRRRLREVKSFVQGHDRIQSQGCIIAKFSLTMLYSDVCFHIH